jgi:prepilin-type N-terminal cleavage/methylation domain-containing protein
MNRSTFATYNSESGFTLTEMLVVVAVLAILSGGIMTLFSQSQDVYESQRDVTAVTQQVRIAMDQMVRYLRQAGNDPLDYLESSSIPPVEILGTGHVRINSDLTGTVPAAGGDPLEASGDPDGTLDNLYERVVFRYEPSSSQLYMDMGHGEEIIAEGVSNFALSFFDEDGNTTTDEDSIVRVGVELVAHSENPGRTTGKVQSFTLQSDVMLRTKTFDVFSAD